MDPSELLVSYPRATHTTGRVFRPPSTRLRSQNWGLADAARRITQPSGKSRGLCDELAERESGRGRPPLDPCGEFLDVIVDLTPFLHLLGDLLLGVHDRRMVAVESVTDLGQREISQFPAQVHGDLAGQHNVGLP